MTSDFLAGAGGRWPLHAGRRKSRSGRKSAEAAAQLLPEPPALPAHAPHPSSALGDGGTPLLPPSSAPFPPWEPRHGSPLPPPAPGSRRGGGFPVAQHGCPLPGLPPPARRPEGGGGEGVAEPCPALSPAPAAPLTSAGAEDAGDINMGPPPSAPSSSARPASLPAPALPQPGAGKRPPQPGGQSGETLLRL